MDRDLTLPTDALRQTLNAQRLAVERRLRSRTFPGAVNLEINSGSIASLPRAGLASAQTWVTVEQAPLDPGRWLLVGSVRHQTVASTFQPAFDFSLGLFTPTGSTVLRLPSTVFFGDDGTQFSLTATLVVTEPAGFTALLRAALNANATSVSTVVSDASLCAIPG